MNHHGGCKPAYVHQSFPHVVPASFSTAHSHTAYRCIQLMRAHQHTPQQGPLLSWFNRRQQGIIWQSSVTSPCNVSMEISWLRRFQDYGERSVPRLLLVFVCLPVCLGATRVPSATQNCSCFLVSLICRAEGRSMCDSLLASYVESRLRVANIVFRQCDVDLSLTPLFFHCSNLRLGCSLEFNCPRSYASSTWRWKPRCTTCTWAREQ